MTSETVRNFVVPNEGIKELADADVVARVLAGDTPLYELVMRRHNRVLFRLARSIVSDDDEARDVVQAAYVQSYCHLDQFRGPSARAWLARITINEACSRVRRARPMADAEQVLALPGLDAAEPENAAMGRELLGIMQAAIDRLPAAFRSVFVLRAVEQLSVAETAELLDLKQATVKTRFLRARRLLQAALQRTLDEAAPGTFPFEGARCDAIVARVLAQIGIG